jgi:zinc D-Ala-D-Ala carboxypeptidase
MRLTAHFALAEFTRSESAKRHGVSNEPTPDHLENLKVLCEKVLEPIRMKFGHPINISSGYRSKTLNHYIGGTLKSQHLEGKAVDLDLDNTGYPTTNKMLFDYIKDNLEYDQIINEFNYSWIHVSYNQGKNRKQVLDAIKDNGRTVYAPHK